MDATGSASLMGLLMMVSTLPMVVVGPLAGTLADRHSRKSILIGCDLVRGLAMLALAVLMATRAEATGLIVAALLVVAIVGGLANAAFQPALAAAIPDLVDRDRVTAASSLTQFSRQASTLLGQAMGGVLYRILGAPVLFLVNGLSFLFSAASEGLIRVPQRLPAGTHGWRKTVQAYREETLAGFRYLWQWKGMRNFLITAAGVNFFFMPIFVLLPFYVTDVLERQADWYGFLLAAMSLGALAGLIAAGGVRMGDRFRARLLQTIFLLIGVLGGVLGAVPHPWLALTVCFALGSLSGMLNLFVIALFQLRTPGEMRGRIMALVITTSGAAAPFGMALGGALGDLTGKDVPLIFAACGSGALFLAAFAGTRPELRRFLAGEDAPPPWASQPP
jgi:MFS transporter, DHA3 family, macrolide efflux protein